MKEIPLTKGYVALVDDEDFDLVSRFTWHAREDHRTVYAGTRMPKDGRLVFMRMHRLILNAPSDMQVDHINHNGLDNTRANLRVCTHAQNQHNLSFKSNNSSGYKGVDWKKDKRKWRAKISLGGNPKHIGYFACPIEAAQAYDRKALELFGDFAALNFPSN